MAITIKKTNDVKQLHVKCICYGPSGTGKTTLCSTAPSPIILSAESGLMSLRGFDLPYIEISSYKELEEAHTWCVSSKEASKFQTICLDSITEIAEVILADLKKKVKDPRQAYGELQESMMGLLRSFRDLPNKHIYFSAKQEKIKDEQLGAIYYGPMMPGKQLSQQLPYLFDEVFNSLTYEDKDTKETSYWLRTKKDGQYEAKDRSGALDPWEQPNLTDIFGKILG
jgi:hypothetical protein